MSTRQDLQEFIDKLRGLAEEDSRYDLTGRTWRYECDKCGGVKKFIDWMEDGLDLIFFERKDETDKNN